VVDKALGRATGVVTVSKLPVTTPWRSAPPLHATAVQHKLHAKASRFCVASKRVTDCSPVAPAMTQAIHRLATVAFALPVQAAAWSCLDGMRHACSVLGRNCEKFAANCISSEDMNQHAHLKDGACKPRRFTSVNMAAMAALTLAQP